MDLSINKAVQVTAHTRLHTRLHIMPSLNIMSRENSLSLPRLSVSIPMIGRILLLVLNIIIIGIIGYYFAYYRGSYRHNLFDEELMVLVCAVSAFINTVIMVTQPSPPGASLLWKLFAIQVMVAMTSSYHQSDPSLQTSYAELISSGVSAFLLIIAGMVLLIQVGQLQSLLFWFPREAHFHSVTFQMSVHGKYFVAHYEAKVFSGVLALLTGVFYVVFAIFQYRQIRS